ncbi:glutamine amidotransferase [Corynebacterium aquilae]|uniref:Glutamine amidotransferase n=1 Tax=Corynebacterium aquilae DSM 44791 TaxID=1431546 RepID=A0A1L7CG33_9CORY|nr:glutamine amidotransferase [Corynebacterium aquilae]APT84785.1 glutamine amidotransferase [Corynebacterium aquilae DSM 44791]
MPARFLLVSPRSGEEIARAERGDFLRATGLKEEQLDQVMLDTCDATIGPLDPYAGVFVGGSPLNITTDTYDEYQQAVHAQLRTLIDGPVPTMFVCFGAGFITHELGGHVGRTHPESAGPSTVELTADGRKDPLLKNLPAEFSTLTGHTENIIIPPLQAVVLATAPSCPTQMIRYGQHTWACQFHADMDPAAMKARMDFYYDYGYFSPADYDDIVSVLPGVDTQHSNAILHNFVTYCTKDHD